MTDTTGVNTNTTRWTAAKFWVAFIMAMLATATQVFSTGTIQQVLTGVEVFLSSAFVYFWPNRKV